MKKAVGIYESIDPKRFVSLGVSKAGFATYSRSFLARARLCDQLGDRDRAIAWYEAFISRWKGADAQLQPQVKEARDAVARLRDNPIAVPVGTKRGK